MTTTGKVWVSVALVAFLLLGGWASWFGETFPGRQADQATEDSSAEQSAHGEMLNGQLAPRYSADDNERLTPAEVPDEPAEPDQVATRVLVEAARASSAGQLQELARNARDKGDEALARQLELMEDGTCGPLLRNDVGSHVVQSGEGFRRWEEFCSDSVVDLSAEAELLRREFLDKLGAEVKRKSEDLLALIERMSPEDAFLQLLAESASPFEIDAIALLRSNGYIDLELASYLTSGYGALDGNALHAVLGVAPQFYSCERFGHCGPQSIEAIEACLFVHECQPGHDYFDLMGWVMSPRELDLAWQFVDLIRQREVRDGP